MVGHELAEYAHSIRELMDSMNGRLEGLDGDHEEITLHLDLPPLEECFQTTWRHVTSQHTTSRHVASKPLEPTPGPSRHL